MKILIFLGIAFFGLVSGCQHIYLAATESKVTVISYESLLQDGIDNSWVKVTDAEFSVMDTFYHEGFVEIKKLYIPLTPKEKEKIKYFLVSDDEELIKKFGSVKDLEDEVEILLQMGKLFKLVDKHSTFTAMTDGIGDIPSKISDQFEKETNISDDPVFFIHNKEPNFGEGLLRLAFGAGGVFLLYYTFSGGNKNTEIEDQPPAVEPLSEEEYLWPTLLDENGQAPTLIELLAESESGVAQQALYLTKILEPLQKRYYVEAIQVPLRRDNFKITAPAQLKDSSGAALFLYTEVNPWGEKNFQTLLYWMGAFREIYPEGKVLVCSADESEHVLGIANIEAHEVIS